MAQPFGGSFEQPQSESRNESLNPLYSIALTANHLIQISLAQRIPNDPSKDYKEKIIVFFTLAPGKGQGNDRTYDFQNRITQKFNLRFIEGLAYILQQCALGNDKSVLPYSRFTKSNKEDKMLSVWVATKDQQFGQQTVKIKSICVTLKTSQIQNGYTLGLSLDEAYSFGSQLHELFKKGFEKELELQLSSPRSNGQSNKPQNKSFTQPQPSNFEGGGSPFSAPTELVDGFSNMFQK